MFFLHFLYISNFSHFVFARVREEIEKHAGDGPRAALSPIFTSSRPFSRNMSLKPALHHFRQLFLSGWLNTNLMECQPGFTQCVLVLSLNFILSETETTLQSSFCSFICFLQKIISLACLCYCRSPFYNYSTERTHFRCMPSITT